MSRRRAAEKRDILPDPKFGDQIITRLMNAIMYHGKKSAAETIVYGAFDDIQKKTKGDPVKFFHDALQNVRPQIEVRSRRVGGATYQVPVEVRSERSQALALRWIIEIARKRSENTGSRGSCSTPPTIVAPPSKSVKTRTRWPRPTKPFRITAGNRWALADNTAKERTRRNGSHHTPRSVPQHRHHGPYRCR
jgi:small subunit ribosomal protein S7